MPLPTPNLTAEALGLAPANPDWDATMAQSAVAIVIDWDATQPGPSLEQEDTGKGPAVLLMQRAEHPSDPWSGQVSLPGGRAEREDKHLLATSIREAREELHIDLDLSAQHLGELPAQRAMAKGRYVDLWITPHVFELKETVTPKTSVEAKEFFWLPLGPARRGDLDHRIPYRREGASSDLLLPGFQFEKRVIWGLTFRMLLSLFQHTSGPIADNKRP